MKLAKSVASTTVITPATAIESELMAPSTSPSSIAFAVPIAWAAVPRANPLEIGSFILKILQINSPNIFPRTPVITITATVIVTYPPSSSAATCRRY